jgi:hypothetical protein
MRTVAEWKTKGKDFIRLEYSTNVHGGYYRYTSNYGGGTLPVMADDKAAIEYMERPWGHGGAGPVTVLLSDRSSLKRVV